MSASRDALGGGTRDSGPEMVGGSRAVGRGSGKIGGGERRGQVRRLLVRVTAGDGVILRREGVVMVIGTSGGLAHFGGARTAVNRLILGLRGI